MAQDELPGLASAVCGDLTPATAPLAAEQLCPKPYPRLRTLIVILTGHLTPTSIDVAALHHPRYLGNEIARHQPGLVPGALIYASPHGAIALFGLQPS